MAEMTTQEAIDTIQAYIDGYHVPKDREEALRLAVEALREKGERERMWTTTSTGEPQ